MSYHDDLQAERAWNETCGRPGRQTIDRKHYAFKRGQQDFHDGKTTHTYLQGGEAERHWNAGQNDAARADDIAEKNPPCGGDWVIGY